MATNERFSHAKNRIQKTEAAPSKIVEDIGNRLLKEKKSLSSKLDGTKEYNTNQGKELSHDESQNHKGRGSVAEAISKTVDGRRDAASYRSNRREQRDCRGWTGQRKKRGKNPSEFKE